MLTHNSYAFLCPQLWSTHLGPISVHTSEETVHALDCLAAIVHAFGSDALAAGVVKPAVLGSSHRLAVQFALADGHAVIKVDHRAHVFWKETNQKLWVWFRKGVIRAHIWQQRFISLLYSIRGITHHCCTFRAAKDKDNSSNPAAKARTRSFLSKGKFFCMHENPTHSGLLFTLVLILWPQVTARVRKYTWKTWPELTGGENSIQAASK